MRWTLAVIGLVVSILLTGCAAIQEIPPSELDCSRLSCSTNPEIVDGDLNTASALSALRSARRSSGRNIVQGDAGTVISLDEPTYIKYVEVYAASRLYDVNLRIAATEPKEDREIRFDSVSDKSRIREGQMRRFPIGRKILYLKLTANWAIDRTSGRRIALTSESRMRVMLVPVKGPMVSEVKFYTM